MEKAHEDCLAEPRVEYVPEYMIAMASRSVLLGPTFSIPLEAMQSSYPSGLVNCIGALGGMHESDSERVHVPAQMSRVCCGYSQSGSLSRSYAEWDSGPIPVISDSPRTVSGPRTVSSPRTHLYCTGRPRAWPYLVVFHIYS